MGSWLSDHGAAAARLHLRPVVQYNRHGDADAHPLPTTSGTPSVTPTRTPTPTPTSTPGVLQVQLTANPTTLTAGQCATVNWRVSGPWAAIFLDNAIVQSEEQRQVCPSQTQTLTLRAEYAGGAETRTVTLQVTGAGGPPRWPRRRSPPRHRRRSQPHRRPWRRPRSPRKA
ncbi:MAG: hypothetical protein HZY76_06450 [Anaerolineae bacterium]|nr:MAG: hypothetical protein HZY76_06450 [Anaerolineae bacterium]